MTADTDYPQAILLWLETNDTPLLCQRSLHLWNAIYGELSPLVGIAGFMALYGRCIDVCGVTHPWLRRAPASCAPALCFDTLVGQLRLQGVGEAQAASMALALRFHDLLQLLIGAALTEGVFDAAWRCRAAPLSATSGTPGTP